jgi:serine phosphatase RsbU (regulator of sigma subunit)
LIARLERVARNLFLLVVAIGFLSLVGQVLGATWITSIEQRRLPQPWGSLLLIGAALGGRHGLLRQPPPRWSRAVLAATATLSLAVLISYGFGDPALLPPWLLMVPPQTEDVYAGLPAPNLALVILLVTAGAILGMTRSLRLRLVSQVTVALAGVIALIVLVGFVYGDRDSARLPFGLTETAISSAIAGLILVAAVLTARPGEGFLRHLVSQGVGGVLLRRLVPAVLLVPPFLVGLLVFRARFDVPGILALIAVAFTAVMLGGLLATARELDRFHLSQQSALEQASRATTALTQAAPVITHLERALSLVEIHQVGTIEAAARYSAADGLVAGDSLAVFPIGSEDLGVVMVDAAGHGAQPALHALRLRDSLAQALRLGVAPGEAIASIAWLVDGPGDMATVAVAVADGQSGRIRLALGGHPPPFLEHHGGVSPLGQGGPLLHPEVQGHWEDQTVELSLGDRLILYTDGIADVFSTSPQGDGLEELADFIRKMGPADADSTAAACLAYADRNGQRQDDRAVVVLERVG